MKAKEALKNLKICFVTPNYLPAVGGTEVAIHEIGKRLVEKGYDITLITRVFGVSDVSEHTDGIEIYRFAGKSGKIGFIITQLKILKKIKELDKTKNFDILHQFHVFALGGASVFAQKILKKPLVTSLMGGDTYNPFKNPIAKIFNPYMSWIMNNSDVVTSPCNELIHHAKNQGLKKDAVVIPHGVDLDDFNPNKYSKDIIHKNFGILNDETMVLSLQRLHKLKSVEYLINAIPGVTKKSPNVKFIIVGEGPQKKELEELVKKGDIEDNVIFTGFVPHGEKLLLLLSSCDIFAFHSNYESFGIVLVEAMASGKPVISTDVGAIPEIVDDGKTGIIVPPRDPKALANAILKLVRDKDLRIKMGIEGRKKAEREYNWDRIVEMYEGIYESLTSL